MENFLWGLWNGYTAFFVLIVHLFDAWGRYPVYNTGRDHSGWYQFGYLWGVGAWAGGGLSIWRRR